MCGRLGRLSTVVVPSCFLLLIHVRYGRFWDVPIGCNGSYRKFTQMTSYDELTLELENAYVASAICPRDESVKRPICTEIGCQIGKPCRQKGLQEAICCPYKIKGRPITCCLKQENHTSTVSDRESCLPYLIAPTQDCLSIGCNEGNSCSESGLSYTKCCSYLWKSSTVKCCLKSTDLPENSFLSEINQDPNYECPPYVMPEGSDCLEIGCTLGYKCLGAEVKNQTCCQHVVRDTIVNCCLKLQTTRE